MKKSASIGAISAGALLLALLAPSAAFAASKTGYVGCNPDRVVNVSSTIDKANSSHATLHITSVRAAAYFGSGSFTGKHAISSTSWDVRSDATITRASASCTK